MNNKTVIMGMSGGVDSSVGAYLLKKQGYNVIGVTMNVWGDVEETAVADAKKVAESLSIPYYVVDFKSEFKDNVIDYFADEYMNAKTPNPCIVCNRQIKWEALMKKGKELGADYIATGHYARIIKLQNGRYSIANSVTKVKDQSYVLYNLTQEQLANTLMPLGEYTKDEIRKIATKIGIEVANKPDSQEICFIPDNDYAGFIKKHFGYQSAEGNFIDMEGNVLGRHKGIIHYTIGQRKGLNLSLGRPGFVVKILKESNEIVIGTNEDVFGSELVADRVNYMGASDFSKPRSVTAKIRYAHKGAEAVVEEIEEGKVKCTFKDPQRAITPGQAVVFYDGEIVLGGGIIC